MHYISNTNICGWDTCCSECHLGGMSDHWNDNGVETNMREGRQWITVHLHSFYMCSLDVSMKMLHFSLLDY